MHFLELLVAVTFSYLIVPGLNQSGALYKDILSRFDGGEIFLFASNLPDRDAFHNKNISTYSAELKNFLSDKSFDYIFCHSLGALVISDILDEVKSSKIKLISPAFKGRVTSKVMNYLPANLKIPSFNRPSWRVHSFCLVKHYQQILDLQSKLDINSLSDYSNVEVIYDIRDELIDTSVLRDLNNRREYYSMNFPRHLCLDYIEKELFRLLR